MLAVSYIDFQNDMELYMDKVTNDGETIVITRRNNKNVVVLSERAYNNFIENVYIMGNKANYDWLIESKTQLEAQKGFRQNSIEVDEDI